MPSRYCQKRHGSAELRRLIQNFVQAVAAHEAGRTRWLPQPAGHPQPARSGTGPPEPLLQPLSQVAGQVLGQKYRRFTRRQAPPLLFSYGSRVPEACDSGTISPSDMFEPA